MLVTVVFNISEIAVPPDPTPPPLQSSYHSDDSGEYVYDYTERRTLPLSIPDYQSIDTGTEKYVVCILCNIVIKNRSAEKSCVEESF